jgi:protein-tyrosine-phosphatase
VDPELIASARGASDLLFLCSGNMVRSPFAEIYARHLGCPLPVRSAATTYRNRRLFTETVAALRERGVEAETIERFRPTHLSDVIATLDPRTVALAMSRAHLEALPAPGWNRRAFLLARALDLDAEIEDPVLEGASFEQTFATVARCVEALVAALR